MLYSLCMKDDKELKIRNVVKALEFGLIDWFQYFTEIRSIMKNGNISLDQMIDELKDAGEIIPRGGDYYEDLGGHIIHESNVPSYFENYKKSLTAKERDEVLKRLGISK